MRQLYQDLFALIRSALHHEAPALSCSSDEEWIGLLSEAKRHLLSGLAYSGLSASSNQPSDRVLEQWKNAKEKVIYQSVLMEKEREAVFHQLQEQGVVYMPLKGYWLRDLYPSPWMRQMVDTDLLIESEKRALVRDMMKARGYEVERYGAGHHDVYVKSPFCCFEMHTAFFGESEAPQLYAFFEENKVYDKPLSSDLFYLYFIAHLYNHDRQSGIGLRSLVDCYLFLKKMGHKMDRSLLLDRLKLLKLDAFERQVRVISFKLLDSVAHALSDEEEAFLENICRSGAVGTLDMCVKKNVQRLQEQNKLTKWAYYKSRIFLPYDWFKDHIPFYARHRWLIPAYYVFRFFRAILFRRKRLKAEFKALKKESI